MISIPKPCSEDFAKMTPTERGAFCGKCQIDTFDFRNLSDLDINKIIKKNKGQHLCGKLKISQLDSLNQGFLNWKNQRKQTFRSKFVLALVLVFGLSLFSCNVQEQRTIRELQSKNLMNNPMETKEYVNTVSNKEELDLLNFVSEIETLLGTDILPSKEQCAPDPIDSTKKAIMLDFPEPDEQGAMIDDDYYHEYLEETLLDSTTKLH